MGTSLRAIFCVALAVRVANALVSRTFFQPDEYWQSLEVAHRLVFGYGYQTWEWRAQDGSGGIRSPLFPFVFVPVYWLLKLTGLDGGALLVIAPKLFQAVIATSCDVSTVALGRRLFGNRVTNATAFVTIASFFNAYTSTRTFSNSTETALTTAALALWPWDGIDSSPVKENASKKVSYRSLAEALGLAAVATVLRPSNVIIWLVMGLSLLSTTPSGTARLKTCGIASAVGVIAMAFCVIADTTFYGTLSFTPYTFLVQNVFNSISLYYGANSFHFYLTQALPFTTMTLLPFILHGLCTGSKDAKPRLAATVALTTIATYSLLGHKEFRFIYPILPILHCFAANSLVSLFDHSPGTGPARPSVFYALSVRPSHAALVLASLGPALYLTAFHSLAQVTIMETLRTIPSTELRSVGFLVPCHSTPWQSHLHRRDLELDAGGSGDGGRAWFLSCEPPVLGQNASTYRDQSDYFYDDPVSYLDTRFPSTVDPTFPPSPFVRQSAARVANGDSNDLGWRHEWPSHLVAFDALLVGDHGAVAKALAAKGYHEKERLWNSHWHEDDRRRGDLVIFRWTG